MVAISIIIPVFNVEKYLRRCLDSLVNQTLKDIELIFVYDTSTDNTLDILKNYRESFKFIKIIELSTNRKQGGARNRGIEIAKGEYLGFVDGDDWVALDMFEKLYSKAKETNCDIVECDYYVIDGNNKLEIKTGINLDQTGDVGLVTRKTLILNPGSIWTKIYKRELFLRNNVRFPESLTYEDNPVVPLLLALSTSVQKVPEPLYYYCMNSQSTVHLRNSLHHFDRLKTSIIMIEEFKKRELYTDYAEELQFKFTEMYYLNTITLCIERFDIPEIERLYEVRNYMRTNYKNYRKNKYFKKTWVMRRILSRLNDINPILPIHTYWFLVRIEGLLH